MRQSLFGLLRGTEGRGLARALAALLFVAAIAGQFPPGLHAAAAGDVGVICAAASDTPGPHAPATPDACCLAICAGILAPVIAPAAPGLLLPLSAPSAGLRAANRAFAPLASSVTSHSPRGPPLPG
jgi:hypothetical protein